MSNTDQNPAGETSQPDAAGDSGNAPTLDDRLDSIAGQMTLFRHQVLQQLGGLGGLVAQQSAAVKAELDLFRTGGPKHAMAAVFHKLFRDLVGHMNALDEMAAGQAIAPGDAAAEWQRAFQIARQRFEALLVDWGCEPMPIAVGHDGFDPDIHEAVAADDAAAHPDAKPELIVAVRRRGWRLHGTIVQYPLVVVSKE